MTSLKTANKSAGLTLKADMIAMTVLQLTETCVETLGKQLRETIANAPTYFASAPIIIDLTKIPTALKEFVDLKAIHELIHELKLIPVGVRGISQKQADLVKKLGLAILNTRVSESATPEPKAEPIPAKKAIEKAPEQITAPKTAASPGSKQTTTKIITKPVRSGMQVYAKGGDLMVLSTVNPGAEVIADGNIYVFGALRGRALAGASGNKQARIICQSLEAELIAIAGQYLTKETLGEMQKTQGMLHVYLDDKKLMIEPTQ